MGTAGADGEPAAGVCVLLLPATFNASTDIQRWESCFTGGKDGSCEMSMPPGDYLIVPVPLSLCNGNLVEEMARRAAGAERVTLLGGERRSVSIVWQGK